MRASRPIKRVPPPSYWRVIAEFGDAQLRRCGSVLLSIDDILCRFRSLKVQRCLQFAGLLDGLLPRLVDFLRGEQILERALEKHVL